MQTTYIRTYVCDTASYLRTLSEDALIWEQETDTTVRTLYVDLGMHTDTTWPELWDAEPAISYE